MEQMNYADVEQLMQNEEFLMLFGFVILGFVGVMFVAWLFTLYPRYYMIKKSGVGPAWSAFIPVWQDMQMFKLAGWKGWYYFIYLAISIIGSFLPTWLSVIVSIASIVLYCVLYWKVCANFGLGTFGKVLSLFLTWFVFWYVALTKKEYCNTMIQNNYPPQNTDWYHQN